MRITTKRTIGVVTLAAVLAATSAACSEKAAPTQPASGRIEGLEAPLTLEQRVRGADLVVRGIPTSDRVLPFTANPAIPLSSRNDPFYVKAGYHEVTVAVSEVLKGSAPATISVMRLAPPPGFDPEGQPEPVLGKEQVLILFSGKGIWTGGYLVLGLEGLGSVLGESIQWPSGKTSTLAQLKALV